MELYSIVSWVLLGVGVVCYVAATVWLNAIQDVKDDY